MATTKNSFELGKTETEYESVRDCLIAIDTIMKTSQAYPKLGFKLAQKNNFLVLENIWFDGKPKDQERLRNERNAVINLAWLLRTVETVAIYHDLIPIICDAGFNRLIIRQASNLNNRQHGTFFDYVCVRHPDSNGQLEHLASRSKPVFYAPKEIIFEWLSINRSPNPQRKVLLLNKPTNEQRH